MLGRNRELRRLALAHVVLTALLSAGALVVSGPAAAVWVLAASAALGAVHGLATRARYRAIARMSEQVDAVLHGERALGLDTMREGELSGLACELDKMVARLDRTARDLERETMSLADSLADISHQLKTPLTSSALQCELIRKRLAASPCGLDGEGVSEVAARLRGVQRLQERVQWLVAALLRLARIDAGVVRLSRGHVDAAALVEEACDELALAFDIADVRLERVVEPGCGFTGDASWSREALVNVLKNCLEHTPAGGRVRLSVRQDALACRIRVEDTGPGIALEDLPHVFERFWRGSAVAASEGVDPAGVGIGLSLARSLVAAQGGAIKAGNVRDRGGAVAGAAFDLVFFNAVV